MNDLERRIAWNGARAALCHNSFDVFDAWPEALTPEQIGKLHAWGDDGKLSPNKFEEIRGFFEDEIAAGRIATVVVEQNWVCPVVILEDEEALTPRVHSVNAIGATDCATALQDYPVGHYLAAWLAPYRAALASAPVPDNTPDEPTTYYLPMYPRLQPRTPWRGRLIEDTDALTLEEGARLASVHAGTEITTGDILRAAKHGKIRLRAIANRSATFLPCRSKDEPLPMEEHSIPTLPLEACQQLANVGSARWRTYDGHEPAAAYGGERCRFVRWRLPKDAPDLTTTLDECRVIRDDVHALADAFLSDSEQVPDTCTPSQQEAPVRPMKAAEIIERLSVRFPGIARALMKDSPKRPWVADAWKSHGIYDFEKIKAGCEKEWPHLAELQAQSMSPAAQLARMNNR